MKDYYKKNADRAEKLLKLLIPGYELKIKEIGLKLTATKSSSEKEELVEELLEMSNVIQDIRYDYETNLVKYKEEKEKKQSKETQSD